MGLGRRRVVRAALVVRELLGLLSGGGWRGARARVVVMMTGSERCALARRARHQSELFVADGFPSTSNRGPRTGAASRVPQFREPRHGNAPRLVSPSRGAAIASTSRARSAISSGSGERRSSDLLDTRARLRTALFRCCTSLMGRGSGSGKAAMGGEPRAWCRATPVAKKWVERNVVVVVVFGGVVAVLLLRSSVCSHRFPAPE